MHKKSALKIGVWEFRKTFRQMVTPQKIAAIGRRYHSGFGAPAKVSLADLVMSCVYHEMQSVGDAAEHTRQVVGTKIAHSSLSERRQNLDREVFKAILGVALKPLANVKNQAEAFFRGWRLLGIDGTEFSVPNTEEIEEEIAKARSRRGAAAFAKIRLCVISELGLHNPIAAAVGWEQESELAREIFSQIPEKSLLIGDRYYGVGKCISGLMPLLQERKSHFLFRLRQNLKSKLVEKRPDGSALVEVKLFNGQSMRVRQIEGRILARNGQWVSVRLWTSLLEVEQGTAAELLELYARRWELEIANDELKNKLHRGHLLKSHCVSTALQEIAALVMAQGLIARVRTSIAEHGKVPTLRVSFNKTLRHVQGFWTLLQIGGDLLEEKQMRGMMRRVQRFILDQLTPLRRHRSCPRAVRQPVTGWPRLQTNTSFSGPIRSEITPI